MTTSDRTRTAERSPAWRDTAPPGRRAGRAAARRDDPRGEGGTARQPLGRSGHPGRGGGRRGRHPQRRTHAGRVRGRVGAQPGRRQHARPRSPHPRVRQRPGQPGRGGGRAGPPAPGGSRGVPARRPGARPRGVPDRVHHVRGDRLPGRDRLGRDLRPRAGRADGRRDRPGHGRARRAPGPVPGARRGPGLPVGSGRGDHRRGPVPGLDARRRLRPRAAGRGRAGHSQALRRLLGLPRRPQPRPGLDGPARAARRDPAAVRDRGRRRRRLGDELVLRRRRRARRRRLLAAHRGAAGRAGDSAAPSSPTTGRCRSWPPCTGSRPTPGGAGALALAAGIDVELPDTIGFGAGLVERVRSGEVPEELVDRAARRVLRQKVRARPARPGLDAGGARCRRRPVDLDSAANRALAREMAERSVVLLDAGTGCRCSARTGRRCAGWPRSGRAPPTRARSWAATPSPTTCCPAIPGSGSASRCRPRSTRCGPSCPASRSRYEQGCAVQGGDRSGFAAAVAAARDGRPVRRVRRRPGRPVRPGHLRRGLRRRGPAAARACRPTCSTSCSRPARRWSSSWSPAGRTRSARCAGRAALVQAFMPGEEGGAAMAGVLSGRVQPGGKLPVQIPRRPGGQPSTYLQPPLGSPESAGISPLDPTPLFPFGHGRSYTTFEVDDLRLDAAEIGTDGEFGATVRVRNTGERAGDEVVQLYLRDVLARVVRPVRQLAGFARVRLEPGEARDVRFRVHADRTALHRPRPGPGRRARRARGAGGDLGGRPALPGHRPDHRPAARWSGTTAGWTPLSTSDRPRARSRPERAGSENGGRCGRQGRRRVQQPGDAGDRGGVRRRFRRHGVQGAQRSQRRRAGDPRAGAGPAARSTTTLAAGPTPAGS